MCNNGAVDGIMITSGHFECASMRMKTYIQEMVGEINMHMFPGDIRPVAAGVGLIV